MYYVVARFFGVGARMLLGFLSILVHCSMVAMLVNFCYKGVLGGV